MITYSMLGIAESAGPGTKVHGTCSALATCSLGLLDPKEMPTIQLIL